MLYRAYYAEQFSPSQSPNRLFSHRSGQEVVQTGEPKVLVTINQTYVEHTAVTTVAEGVHANSFTTLNCEERNESDSDDEGFEWCAMDFVAPLDEATDVYRAPQLPIAKSKLNVMAVFFRTINKDRVTLP